MFTYGSRQEFCMFDTHPSIGERRSFAVPKPVSSLIFTMHRKAMATHKLDGDLLIVQQVGALEDDTKRTLANLLPNPVVHTDNVR